MLNVVNMSIMGRMCVRATVNGVCACDRTWSVYERTINGQARTNNFAEAAHRRLQEELGVDHPSIWKLIDGLRKVQKARDQVYEGLVRGDPPPKKRRKYIRA